MGRQELIRKIKRTANIIEGIRNWIDITDDPAEVTRLQRKLKDLQYQQLFQIRMLTNTSQSEFSHTVIE